MPKCLTLPSAISSLTASGHIFDRHVRIDAVLIEQIDVIGPQTFQAGVGHRFDMLGPAIGATAALPGLKIDVEAELCGNHHFVADGLERFADQLFVRERPVGFGRVEHRHAKVIGGTSNLIISPLSAAGP